VFKELSKAYRKLGVDVLTSTKVEKIDDSGGSVTVTVSNAKGTQERSAGRARASRASIAVVVSHARGRDASVTGDPAPW
jgi:phytoene dehydrogenase-like protein